MNIDVANLIVDFIGKLIDSSKLIEPIRLVSFLKTNGYVGSVFEKRNFQYKYVEGFNFSPDQLNPLSDILYVEIPDDYTFKQHEDLSKRLSELECIWVVYTPFADLVKNYYSEFTKKGNIFTNGV